ncbi:hypothetical protein [Paenibacillus cremeus]|uniref:KinB signaling pathway activation protein n=1 Tax=Paenibacillus cremeus TaxID=2163881 RepID=A0A559KFB7_9BACL|nr:hypothetical protein [Paenibacillus cremeus]TVY10815.1 hypothetical protein FPZ49_06880 [Paenibacillus cremeus]
MGFVFAYSFFAVVAVYIWFMPKRLTRQEIYTTWGLMAAITVYTDMSFGLVLDLYDFGGPEVNFQDVPLQALFAPSIAVVFLNYMPRKTSHFIGYLLVVVLISLFIEWICTLTGYLVYKGWKMEYSAPFYLLGMIILRWHLHFLRRGLKPSIP